MMYPGSCASQGSHGSSYRKCSPFMTPWHAHTRVERALRHLDVTLRRGRTRFSFSLSSSS